MECYGQGHIGSSSNMKNNFDFDKFWERTIDILLLLLLFGLTLLVFVVSISLCVAHLL